MVQLVQLALRGHAAPRPSVWSSGVVLWFSLGGVVERKRGWTPRLRPPGPCGDTSKSRFQVAAPARRVPAAPGTEPYHVSVSRLVGLKLLLRSCHEWRRPSQSFNMADLTRNHHHQGGEIRSGDLKGNLLLKPLDPPQGPGMVLTSDQQK